MYYNFRIPLTGLIKCQRSISTRLSFTWCLEGLQQNSGTQIMTYLIAATLEFNFPSVRGSDKRSDQTTCFTFKRSGFAVASQSSFLFLFDSIHTWCPIPMTTTETASPDVAQRHHGRTREKQGQRTCMISTVVGHFYLIFLILLESKIIHIIQKIKHIQISSYHSKRCHFS